MGVPADPAPRAALPGVPAPGGMPLLRPKRAPPPPRPDLVARPRLGALLRRGLARPLTLVAAPAGYGKTTLLSARLAAAAGNPPVAWVSLDPADNHPARFWAYVLAAPAGARPGL